jgi:hypothetical protein
VHVGFRYLVSVNGTISFTLNTTRNESEYEVLPEGVAGDVRVEKVTEARPVNISPFTQGLPPSIASDA